MRFPIVSKSMMFYASKKAFYKQKILFVKGHPLLL